MTAPAPHGEDLAVLMAAYQDGCADAFERLYERLAPLLRRYLRSLTRGAPVDDLVQETFLQIHRARHTYDRTRPVQPWALAVARHVYLMERRSRARKPESPYVGAQDLPEPSVPAHEGGVVARNRLRRGLSGLTPQAREAFMLHHFWGWSFKDIAARLGIRGTAARLRASRGAAALRARLKDDDRDGVA